MKTARRKRSGQTAKVSEPTVTTFSSDLLTPEEERELLTSFWDCKTELVRALIRHFPRLRSHRPPLEPWPMAQFIRDYCDGETRSEVAVRRLHDRYVHYSQPPAATQIAQAWERGRPPPGGTFVTVRKVRRSLANYGVQFLGTGGAATALRGGARRAESVRRGAPPGFCGRRPGS